MNITHKKQNKEFIFLGNCQTSTGDYYVIAEDQEKRIFIDHEDNFNTKIYPTPNSKESEYSYLKNKYLLKIKGRTNFSGKVVWSGTKLDDSPRIVIELDGPFNKNVLYVANPLDCVILENIG